MTQAYMPKEVRDSRGQSPRAWCASPFGIEDVEDIIADLDQAVALRLRIPQVREVKTRRLAYRLKKQLKAHRGERVIKTAYR